MSKPTDKLGVELTVGQRVARATCSSNAASLHVQTVTRVEDGRVYLDNSPQALRNLNNVLVLK